MAVPAFDFDLVVQRLLSEAYGLIAALPLMALALVAVWVCWMLGGWFSRRTLLDRVSQRNPFMRDLARTTVRWGVTLLGVLVALEILNATALVGALLGTAGVLGVAIGFAFRDTLENYLAGNHLRLPNALVFRSEAIRTVKLALEAAHMDMPEPIYRVQLSDRAELAAAPPAPPRPARAPSTKGPVDTGVIDDLTPQIDAEPKSRNAPDLLDPSAPKE